jgi:beta-phosphoglucomutase-like phosphatase (HAD superfamily)
LRAVLRERIRLTDEELEKLRDMSSKMFVQGGTTKQGIHMGVMSEGARCPVRVGVGGQMQELCPGDHWTFSLGRRSDGASSATKGATAMHVQGETFQGAIFDVDGVLVDSPHERAWREGLRELMENEWSDIREQTTWSAEAFTPLVYQQVMSGKPRMAGALAALQHFDVPDASGRVALYASRKQQLVVELIKAGEFEAYPDALRFILAVHAAGIPVAAASSSKNAGLFLERIPLDRFAADQGLEYDFVRPGLSLLDFFDADISGRDFAQGKPHPEIFLTAAKELRAPPQMCVVVEDAVSGVQAAKAGGMAAIGLARAGDAEMLAAADADIVVESLDDVDVDALREGRLVRKVPTWSN